MKEPLDSKDPKKRKSQDSFFAKAKLNPQHPDHLKYGQSKKNQPRASLSLLQFYPSKQYKRRVNSLEMSPADFPLAEPKVKHSSNPKTSNAGNCLSQRCMNVIRDPQKLFKYRKFSSNADLHQQSLCSSIALKQKLSVIQHPSEHVQKINAQKKSEQHPVTAWIIIIRQFFAKNAKKKDNFTINLNLLFTQLTKLHASQIQPLKCIIESISFQPELTKDQLLHTIQSYFRPPASQLKSKKKQKDIRSVTFLQVLNCLVQYQIKLSAQPSATNPSLKHKYSSSDQHQEAVETARFQQGNANEQSKKGKKVIEISNIIGQTTVKSFFEESNKDSLNESKQKKQTTPANSKTRQRLNPSLSPFNIMQSRSKNNSRSSLQQYDSNPSILKKGSFHSNGFSQSSLGLLTLQGKSPRELMQSQIYESMQRFRVGGHRNNISFSLDLLEMQPHRSFEQNVHSFEQILKKIKFIQTNYIQKLTHSDSRIKDEDQPSEEINLFLQQLINYRMAMNIQCGVGEHYSYFVSWQDMKEFKQPSHKIMVVLLQSAYMREYFFALQGLKIQNSPYLLHNIQPLLHPAIRILNISKNNISNLDDLLREMNDNNSIQLLNINHNLFTDICPLLQKFSKIKQLHAQYNCIQAVIHTHLTARFLKMLDLSYNKIRQEDDLIGLGSLQSFHMLNLLENPLTQKKDWKSAWKGLLDVNIIYHMENLYIMSDYGHQKDIAFTKPKRTIKKINIQLQKSF